MASVIITCRNFSNRFAATNGTRTRDVPLLSVLRAVVTVGAQRFGDVYSLGWRGLLHRFSMGLSAVSFLEQSHAGLCLSKRFCYLDGSEKAAATYWYGMALAKVVADVELGIPWLAHVDQMRKSGALTTKSGSGERGDLVGLDSNADWHVVEAKGRSNHFPVSLVTKAKQQSAFITKINGKPPTTTSACIASLFAKPISVLLDDPTASGAGNGETCVVKQNDFFKHYYQGIIKYLRKFGRNGQQTVGETVFVVAPLFPLFGDFIRYSPPRPLGDRQPKLGLLKTIFETPERALDAVKWLPRDDEGGAGNDGVALFGTLPDWETRTDTSPADGKCL